MGNNKRKIYRKNTTLAKVTTHNTTLIINMKSELKIRSALTIMENYEVSWFGIIKKINETTYKLIDIMFPPQENKPTFVTTKDSDYPKWYFDTFVKNGNPNLVRLHGHTHPNFGTNPSGTDIQQFKQIKNEVNDFYIQFIINNKLDTFCLLHDIENDKEDNMKVVFEFTEKLKNILDKVVNKEAYTLPFLSDNYIKKLFDLEDPLLDEFEDYDYLLDTGGYDPYEPK